MVDVLEPMKWVGWENFWSDRRARGARIFVQTGLRGGGLQDFGRALRFLI